MVTIYSRLRQRNINILAVLCIVAALLLAGCGGGAASNPPAPTPTSAAPATNAPSGPPIPTITGSLATATLKHVPTGTADLTWDRATHDLTVKVSLVGLAPSSMHPEHIHTGSCANQGNVIYPLQTLAADAHGVATATTVVKNVTNGIPATGWYVNVHNGPGLSTNDQFLPIACGDVANSSAAQSVNVMLTSAPPASMGESVSGTAQLMLSGTSLTVKLTLSGLEPNSMHAVHIHAGSCESQGPVVYPLNTVVADSSGNASDTTTVTVANVTAVFTTSLYVNVHHSTALSTQTGFDPIACGNVTLGG